MKAVVRLPCKQFAVLVRTRFNGLSVTEENTLGFKSAYPFKGFPCRLWTFAYQRERGSDEVHSRVSHIKVASAENPIGAFGMTVKPYRGAVRAGVLSKMETALRSFPAAPTL